MDMQTMRELATKYSMEDLLDHEITCKVIGLWCISTELIPELDALVEDDTQMSVVADRMLMGDRYRYSVILPTAWMDYIHQTERITLTEYAKRHGKNPCVARQRAARGAFATAAKVGRDWTIAADEPWVDNRAGGRSARWSRDEAEHA